VKNHIVFAGKLFTERAAHLLRELYLSLVHVFVEINEIGQQALNDPLGYVGDDWESC
jgi:hypothetical protein